MSTKDASEPPTKKAKTSTSTTSTSTISSHQEAFTNGRTIASFHPTQLLRFDNNGQHVVIQGMMSDSSNISQPTLIQLTQQATCSNSDQLLENLSTFQVTPTNYSGAEYSFYQAIGLGATFNMEVIFPASSRQIQRKTPSTQLLVEETKELYSSIIQKFAQEQALNIGWLDAVVNLEKELDRNLFHNTDFVINVDTKWSTHAEPLSIDPAVRKTWHKAKWTNDLYLLAIVKDATFKSIRDLQGESGATLCENMRDALRDVALQVYGVPPSQLRIMFHYHPQYYRLHAHCVRIHAVNPGSETERAHLLTTVAFNLRMNANYYKQATLSYKVRAGERLHRLLVDNDNIGLV